MSMNQDSFLELVRDYSSGISYSHLAAVSTDSLKILQKRTRSAIARADNHSFPSQIWGGFDVGMITWWSNERGFFLFTNRVGTLEDALKGIKISTTLGDPYNDCTMPHFPKYIRTPLDEIGKAIMNTSGLDNQLAYAMNAIEWINNKPYGPYKLAHQIREGLKLIPAAIGLLPKITGPYR